MQRVRLLVQAVISAACLVFAVKIVSPQELTMAWASGDKQTLGVVLALMPFAVYSRAWRWWYILRRKKIDMPLTTVGRITFIGHAYNIFLPASLGDVVRSYYAWRERGTKEVMLASALVDKAVALFSLCILGVICSLAVGSTSLTLAAVILALPLALLLLKPNLIPWTWGTYLFRLIFRREMHTDRLLAAFRLDMRTLVTCVGISFLGWSVTNLMYYYAWRAFTPDISAWYAFAFAPLINIMRIVPVTVSGLGSADLLIVFLGQSAGMRESDALMGSLTINVALIILPGLIGAVYLLTTRR